MWISYYIFFILTSLVFIPYLVPDQFWIPKECAYVLMGFTTIGISWITNKRYISFKNTWFGLALIYFIIGFCWYFYKPIMMPQNGNLLFNVWIYRPTLNVILAFFLIKTLVECTDTLGRWVDISKFLCWVGFGFAVFSLIQWLGLDPWFNVKNYQINFTNFKFTRNLLMVTTFSNKLLTTNFIAMLSPMCLMFKGVRYKVVYGIMILAIFLADVTTSMAALGLGLFTYLLLSKKWKSFIVVAILFVLGIFYAIKIFPYFLDHSGRCIIWEQTINQTVNDNAGLLGTGLGSFPGKFFSGKLVALSAHNEFIQMFKENGLLVLVLLVGYLYDLFIRCFDLWRKTSSTLLIGHIAGLMSYFVIAFFVFPLRIAPTALVGITYIACLEAQLQGEYYG